VGHWLSLVQKQRLVAVLHVPAAGQVSAGTVIGGSVVGSTHPRSSVAPEPVHPAPAHTHLLPGHWLSLLQAQLCAPLQVGVLPLMDSGQL
jgi:hypothetical protein